MAFVIDEPCIGVEDVSCKAERLYTDPEECIDCDTSVEACLRYAPTLAGAAGLADAPQAAARQTAARATDRVLRPEPPPPVSTKSAGRASGSRPRFQEQRSLV